MYDERYQRQIELEHEMAGMGVERFWRRIEASKQAESESRTPYGQRLMAEGIEPMAKALAAWVEKEKQKPGRHPVGFGYLEAADRYVVSFITIRVVMDLVSKVTSLQNVASHVGAALEDEARFRLFSTENKPLWKTINKDLDKRTKNRVHKKRVLTAAMKRASNQESELEWAPWETHYRVWVGITCIGLLIEATGLVEITNSTLPVWESAGKRQIKHLQATSKTLGWIKDYSEFCEAFNPILCPMIVPPKSWTGPFEGGYHTEVVRKPFVNARNKNYFEELANRWESMPVVVESTNAVQATPWRINAKVLAVAQWAWRSGIELGVMPEDPGNEVDLPTRPVDIDTNMEAQYKWKKQCVKVYEKRAKSVSKRIQTEKILQGAEKFQGEETIYFPHQLDFRGRLYSLPVFLNPQGNDLSKSLLEFAGGLPIGERGYWWLKVHGANLYGEDKISMDERVLWTEKYEELILQCAADPKESTWWREADKPWQFLAFCFEYAAVKEHGLGYVSHIPVSVDGTCNGLQNFSAMLRDPIGGKATNLVPGPKPNDIYQDVANLVRKQVEADAIGDSENTAMAQAWLAFGFDRKATKRPVMVLPYGGTIISSRQYVEDYLAERVEAGEVFPLEADGFVISQYLTTIIWRSIGEVVVAAREAMDWLRKAAHLAAREELPVNWTTPVGFPVQQAYPEVASRTIKTHIGDQMVRRIEMDIRVEKKKLDRRRQANAISPNFVHSMDAACLMLCVDYCRKAGIHYFAMVHDSYGTHAASMDLLAAKLREAFISLYQHDVLEDLGHAIRAMLSEKNLEEMPDVPAKGSLDLNQVRDSKYFFA